MNHTKKTTVKDMTIGNSFQLILYFFIPLLLGNLFQQFYSLADSIIVGKSINDNALAAVGASSTINNIMFGFSIGLTRGCGIILGHEFGKNNYKTLKKSYINSIYLALIISIIFTSILLLFKENIFQFLNTPENILSDALSYYKIIILGTIVTIFNNFFITTLQSLGNSKTPLIAMIISSATNITLDLIFILIFHLGINGAAYATVIAQAVSCFICALSVSKIELLKFKITDLKLDLSIFNKLLFTGLPVALMNSITGIGSMVLQFFVNQMGSACVAAYSTCQKFIALFRQFSSAVGLTILTYVSQNYGALKLNRIKIGVIQGVLIATIVNIPLVFIQIKYPAVLASLMLSSPESIQYCMEFMPISGLFLFTLGWLFIFRNACQGMGNTLIPLLSGGLEIAFRVIIGIFYGRYSFSGIAVSEILAWLFAWLLLMITFFVMIRKTKLN